MPALNRSARELIVRHLRHRHWCHMQPSMHRMQFILFSILHYYNYYLYNCRLTNKIIKVGRRLA
jgi:hypothetical protein